MRRTPGERRAFTEGTLVGMFLFGVLTIFLVAFGLNAAWIMPVAITAILLAVMLAMAALG